MSAGWHAYRDAQDNGNLWIVECTRRPHFAQARGQVYGCQHTGGGSCDRTCILPKRPGRPKQARPWN
jgi:hypothetical protein